MSSLLAYSSSGQRISLLNPVDEGPAVPPSLAATTSVTRNAELSVPQNAGVDATRRHVCSVCSRGFSTSGHLTRHMKVHTGEKKFSCPVPNCTKRCSRQDNMVQHFRVHLPKADRTKGSGFVRAALDERRALEARRITSQLSSPSQQPSLQSPPQSLLSSSPPREGSVESDDSVYYATSEEPVASAQLAHQFGSSDLGGSPGTHHTRLSRSPLYTPPPMDTAREYGSTSLLSSPVAASQHCPFPHGVPYRLGQPPPFRVPELDSSASHTNATPSTRSSFEYTPTVSTLISLPSTRYGYTPGLGFEESYTRGSS